MTLVGEPQWGTDIDSDLVRDLARTVIETPSPTGHEGDMARVLGEAMRSLGMEVKYQHLYDDRYNVIGRLRGVSKGPTVLFSGHMDTSVVGDEDWLEGAGWKNAAVIDGGWIYGNGIFNMKSAFVSYLAMVDALQRSNCRPPGEVIIAGTVGEIELSPIDEFTGKEFDSYGVGTRFLLNHGVAADFHVLGEPSAMVPLTGMMGTVWVKITTFGDFIHTAFSGDHRDSIDAADRLWEALGPWREAFRRDHAMGSVPARVSRGAVRGGLPWRAARTAAFCSLYLDCRFRPDGVPIDVQREIREAVENAAVEVDVGRVDVEFYMSRPGTALALDHPLVSCVERSHHDITGKTHAAQFSPPVCTDAIDSNRLGVPTVVYGPAGRSPQGTLDLTRDARAEMGEAVPLEDMAIAAGVYGRSALSLLDTSLSDVQASRLPMPAVHIDTAHE